MGNAILIFPASILLIYTASFFQAENKPPNAEPTIEGIITKVDGKIHTSINSGSGAKWAPDDPSTAVSSDDGQVSTTGREIIGAILIEENPKENWGSAKTWVRITDATRIFKRQEQDLIPALFAELQIGDRAEAWFTGPVAESYPGQATGSVVVFLKSDGAVIDYATLIDHLRSAGASVEPFGKVSQAFFSVESQVITVNGGEVHVFEHADVAAADAEAEHISPDRSAFGRPPTTMVHWVATPHFYKTGRLIVLYLGDDRLVTRALEAGLGPQFAGK